MMLLPCKGQECVEFVATRGQSLERDTWTRADEESVGRNRECDHESLGCLDRRDIQRCSLFSE